MDLAEQLVVARRIGFVFLGFLGSKKIYAQLVAVKQGLATDLSFFPSVFALNFKVELLLEQSAVYEELVGFFIFPHLISSGIFFAVVARRIVSFSSFFEF